MAENRHQGPGLEVGSDDHFSQGTRWMWDRQEEGGRLRARFCDEQHSKCCGGLGTRRGTEANSRHTFDRLGIRKGRKSYISNDHSICISVLERLGL